MKGDTFDFEGKNYTVLKEVTFGEYRKINRVQTKLAQIAQKYGGQYLNLPLEQQQQVADELSNTSMEQLEAIAEFLSTALGVLQEDLDKMPLQKAITLFGKAFNQATAISPELKKTSS